MMLNAHGFLKITDFGEAEVFRSPNERDPHKSNRKVGSEPYMAPEEFTTDEFDPRLVDLWACAVIYVAMVQKRIPWEKPCESDTHYQFYLKVRENTGSDGFELLENLEPRSREVIRRMLDPDPAKRITVEEVRETDWFKEISQKSRECIDRGKKERDFYNGALDVHAPSGSLAGCSTTPSLSPFEIHHLRHHPVTRKTDEEYIQMMLDPTSAAT